MLPVLPKLAVCPLLFAVQLELGLSQAVSPGKSCHAMAWLGASTSCRACKVSSRCKGPRSAHSVYSRLHHQTIHCRILPELWQQLQPSYLLQVRLEGHEEHLESPHQMKHAVGILVLLRKRIRVGSCKKFTTCGPPIQPVNQPLG